MQSYHRKSEPMISTHIPSSRSIPPPHPANFLKVSSTTSRLSINFDPRSAARIDSHRQMARNNGRRSFLRSSSSLSVSFQIFATFVATRGRCFLFRLENAADEAAVAWRYKRETKLISRDY